MDNPEIRIGAYQLMPDMASEEFAALKADIAERGVVTPIDVDETGAILDGHHRYRAWCELQRNEPPPIIVRTGLSEAEKRIFAIRQNVHRRHLTRAQMQDLIERELKARPDHSSRRIAADLGVDHKTIGRLRRALAATGEVPQLDARVGADGRVRHTVKASPDAQIFAKMFGVKPGADGLSAEVKLALFKAGVPANSVVGMPTDDGYDPLHGRSDEEQREWVLFVLWLARFWGAAVEGAWNHIEWLLQRPFQNVAEWLGEEGEKWRRAWRMRPMPDALKTGWAAFLAERKALTVAEIKAEVDALEKAQKAAPQPQKPQPMRRDR